MPTSLAFLHHPLMPKLLLSSTAHEAPDDEERSSSSAVADMDKREGVCEEQAAPGLRSRPGYGPPTVQGSGSMKNHTLNKKMNETLVFTPILNELNTTFSDLIHAHKRPIFLKYHPQICLNLSWDNPAGSRWCLDSVIVAQV